jgi:acetylglutamate kinase
MKLVIAISAALTHASEPAREFVESVTELLRDGHRVAIVHGPANEGGPGAASSQPHLVSRNGDYGTAMNCAPASAGNVPGAEASVLSAHLNAAQIHSMVLHGSDAGICKIRKKLWDRNKSGEVEVYAVETRWIETICANRGVPVISNLLMNVSGNFYTVDTNHLAALCAMGWNADLLVYMTEEEGVKDLGGTVLRWLEAEEIDPCAQNAVNKALISRLKFCKQALQGGVHRVRLLPVSRVKCLPLFYFSRIEYGTEVILSCAPRRTEAAVAAHGSVEAFPLRAYNKQGGR